MNIDLILENLQNPALLFFFLGIVAVLVKSDLEIPPNSSKFIALYLLFAIGFKGGNELRHEELNLEVISTILFGLGSAIIIPTVTFFLLKRFVSVFNAGAIAAAYGSVSAVTFVTAVNYLEMKGLPMHGHLVALMAMMEVPAIIMGLLLITIFNREESSQIKKRHAIRHAFTNGSVLLILGSLLIGLLANESQAEGIKPFTNDIFKGFLVLFLLDMGISSGRNLKGFFKGGIVPILFAFLMPLIVGITIAIVSGYVSTDPSDRFILAILGASASYIAVPAAMKMAVPKADPGLYLPMALAITFPVNITIGLPLYYAFVESWNVG
jgi:hypothetical protein